MYDRALHVTNGTANEHRCTRGGIDGQFAGKAARSAVKSLTHDVL
jgi:hypothetical protein